MFQAALSLPRSNELVFLIVLNSCFLKFGVHVSCFADSVNNPARDDGYDVF